MKVKYFLVDNSLVVPNGAAQGRTGRLSVTFFSTRKDLTSSIWFARGRQRAMKHSDGDVDDDTDDAVNLPLAARLTSASSRPQDFN